MTAPITYEADFLARGDLVEDLWSRLPWENREGAPRFECWMNDYALPYTYGRGEYARTYEALDRWDITAECIRQMLNRRGHSFDCCFINGYAHGRQHLGWHADDSPEMDHEHAIAVVSIGSPREIWFRPRLGEMFGSHEVQMLGAGSLLVMHAGMQRNWQHRIPKADREVGKRISLTFRRLAR